MNDVLSALVLLRIADMYDRLFEAFLSVEDNAALRLARTNVQARNLHIAIKLWIFCLVQKSVSECNVRWKI